MSRRENTCKKRGCAYWVRYGPKCPHFVTGTWESREGEKYHTQDCAPKRNMILQQQIYDLLLGTRRDFNKMSNASIKVLQLAAQQVGSELMVVDGDYEEQKQIEENTDNGKDTS